MTKQLLQQALDALEDAYSGCIIGYYDAREALRAAIAAPEVEPVGYAYAPDGNFEACVIRSSPLHAEIALYATPPNTEALRTQLDDALKDKASIEKQFEEVKTSLRLCVDRLRFVESQNKALEIATEGEE